MGENDRLRANLVALLDWKDAHVSFDAAVAGIPEELCGLRPERLPYSIWELVEHMRLCQRDILDFCTDPDYVEPPVDRYFSPDIAPSTREAWDESLEGYRSDRAALKRLASDPAIDLFAAVPRGAGQTYLRELLLVADHNAYTLGQLIVLRRLLGIWESA